MLLSVDRMAQRSNGRLEFGLAMVSSVSMPTFFAINGLATGPSNTVALQCLAGICLLLAALTFVLAAVRKADQDLGLCVTVSAVGFLSAAVFIPSSIALMSV
jgi:hypothetical protein